MAVFPTMSSYLQLTRQWHYISVLDLNVGNLPRLFGSGIKCLWFEKWLPWAKVLIFFSHTHTFRTKTIYMNSRPQWSLPGGQGASFPWLWGLQEAGKCTIECLRVLYFWNHSQVRNIQMPPVSQVLLSQLREYLLKTFSFSWQTAM